MGVCLPARSPQRSRAGSEGVKLHARMAVPVSWPPRARSLPYTKGRATAIMFDRRFGGSFGTTLVSAWPVLESALGLEDSLPSHSPLDLTDMPTRELGIGVCVKEGGERMVMPALESEIQSHRDHLPVIALEIRIEPAIPVLFGSSPWDGEAPLRDGRGLLLMAGQTIGQLGLCRLGG